MMLFRALAFLLALTVAAPAPAQAQVGGLGFPGPGPIHVASGNDPATTAWVAAVVAAGGTVSGTQIARVNTLIVALKSAGLFTALDRLFLWAGESDAHQATIDIINLGVGTANAGLTLSASGYTGNNATSFDSGVQPSTFSGNYVLNGASFGLYEIDNGAAGNNNAHGTNATSPSTHLYTYAFVTLAAYNVNNGGFNSFANTAATTQGMWATTRTSSTATAMYRNGSATPLDSQSSDTSTGLPVSHLQWFAGDGQNNNAVLGAGFVGGAMTGAQYASLAAALNAYMTAWGKNVF